MTAKQFYDWQDPSRRQRKRLQDFADIARLVEAHPELKATLPEHIRNLLDPPAP